MRVCVCITDAVAGVSCTDEYSCLSARMSESERLALEAIRTLHAQLDDDANGNIDLSESDEVLTLRKHWLKPITFIKLFKAFVYLPYL